MICCHRLLTSCKYATITRNILLACEEWLYAPQLHITSKAGTSGLYWVLVLDNVVVSRFLSKGKHSTQRESQWW